MDSSGTGCLCPRRWQSHIPCTGRKEPKELLFVQTCQPLPWGPRRGARASSRCSFCGKSAENPRSERTEREKPSLLLRGLRCSPCLPVLSRAAMWPVQGSVQPSPAPRQGPRCARRWAVLEGPHSGWGGCTNWLSQGSAETAPVPVSQQSPRAVVGSLAVVFIPSRGGTIPRGGETPCL